MAAAQAGNWLKEHFSLKAFGQGLAAVALLYAVLFLFIFFAGDKAAEKQWERLASQTVIVDWKIPAPGTVPPPTPGQPGEVTEVPSAEPPSRQPSIEIPRAMESGPAEAPVEGLYEETPLGRAPKIREKDGLTPFAAYRRPFDLYASNAPMVAIAVTGLGLSDIATESAVRTMPPEISFIMSPYAGAIDFWINESRARGHEVWLTLPMESKRYPLHDSGPHTMLIGAPERENQAKMDWLLTRGTGYIGFVTSYHPEFMGAVNDMRPIVGNVYKRGLAFVDGSADPGLTPQTMASGMKAPYSRVDVWIDMPDASPQAIDEALKQLETIANDKGMAVGVIQALPVSYQQVQSWIESLPGKGLQLAPLSATTGF